MKREEVLRLKLEAAFAPEGFKLENTSHFHEGHAHMGDESHFRVMIVARAFEGKSRVERHRMVNEVLKVELEGGLHALEIRALTPAEARGISL